MRAMTGAPMPHDPIGPPRQPRDDDGRCLPPDPSVPGLWWVQQTDDDGEPVRWEVWEWAPDCSCWWRGAKSCEPDWTWDRGWRCHSPAVPPEPPGAR